MVRTDHFGNEDRFKHSIVRCLWDIFFFQAEDGIRDRNL